MNRLYALSSGYETIREASGAVKKMQAHLAGHEVSESLEKLGEDKLDDVIYRAEKLALSCRYALENTGKEYAFSSGNNSETDHDIHGVSVVSDDGTLRIRTPFTFKRAYRDGSLKENYILMNYVRAALTKWQNETQTDLFRIMKAPLTVIIKRCGPYYDRRRICDNDNLENGRIINEIFAALGYSDNALMMDLISIFRIKEDMKDFGMEFIIFPSAELREHIGELKTGPKS